MIELREAEQTVAENLRGDQEHLMRVEAELNALREARRRTDQSVSYTHLDVYKRQARC